MYHTNVNMYCIEVVSVFLIFEYIFTRLSLDKQHTIFIYTYVYLYVYIIVV